MRIFKKLTAVTLALCACIALFATSCDNTPADGTSSTGGASSEAGSTADTSSVVSTGSEVTPPTDGSEAPAVEFALNTQNATLHGKYTEEMGGYSFTYGSAGFSVNFTGTEFWIYTPEVPEQDGGVREVGVAVLVDSDMAMDANMYNINKAGWHKVASGLAEGDHHIEIRKQSRGFFGIMASDWFVASKFGTTAGGVCKTPDKLSDLIIEVYGDSISNGDAVWDNGGSGSSYTFGNYTGVIERLLDAEVRVCANTGNGLCGWVMAQGGNGEVENLLPPQNCWSVIDSQHGNKPYSHEGANAADVVIVNLGTNDRVELGGGDLTDTAFEDEYIRFIKEVKTDCPDAIFICTVGAMGQLKGDKYEVDFDRITSEANKWAGEEFCYYVPLQHADKIKGGPGHDGGHPSNLAHEIYGLQLSTLINKRLNLGKTLPTDIPESAYEGPTFADIAKSGTAIDSGIAMYGGMNKEAVIDGSLSTGWQPSDKAAPGENCWVGIKFNKTEKTDKAVIYWESGTRAKTSTADGYRVEYTADGSTWKTFSDAEYTYGTEADGRCMDTVTFSATSLKGIRVVVLGSSNDKYAPKIYEIELASDKKVSRIEAVTGRSDVISSVEALVK